MIKLILVDVPQETSPDCKAYVHLFDRNENGWFMLDEVETELRDLPQRKLEWNWGTEAYGWNACLPQKNEIHISEEGRITGETK